MAGADSLYDDESTSVWYTGPNVRVSFDRPYTKYCQLAGSSAFGRIRRVPVVGTSDGLLAWNSRDMMLLTAQTLNFI